MIVLFKLTVNCREEADLSYSKSLLQDLSRTTTEKHEHSQDSRYPAVNSNVYLTGL
jgi:hypothetical protein